jgi:hypothetical protein
MGILTLKKDTKLKAKANTASKTEKQFVNKPVSDQTYN